MLKFKWILTLIGCFGLTVAAAAQSPHEDVLLQASHAQHLLRQSLLPPQAAAAILSTPLIHTQEDLTREEALDLVRTRLSPGDLVGFEAFLAEASGGNLVMIDQQGDDNVASVDQTGQGNMALLYHYGHRNTTQAAQTGDDNLVGVWLTGNDNLVGVEQIGDDNIYLLELTGSGASVHSPLVVQNGVGNQAVQLGAARTPFGIRQDGDHMRMIIEHQPGW